MKKLVPAVLSLLVSTAALTAQEGAGLTVEPDAKNQVAASLVGSWRLDTALTERLGGPLAVTRVEFRAGADVVGKVPQPLAAKLRALPGFRIFQQGTMVLDGRNAGEHPYLLITLAGNPTVLWFRERGGDPMGDTESFLVGVAKAGEAKGDLLLLGGDTAREPMAMFARSEPAKQDLTPAAVVTDMIRLLNAGKGREFVETYCSPEDLKMFAERGRTPESMAARFSGERALILVGVLEQALKQAPQLNAAGDEASWEFEKTERTPGALHLKRIEGRWYIQNR